MINCIICNSKTKHAFTKTYKGELFNMLEKSDFSACEKCGFTFSETIFKMNHKDWDNLNFKFHTFLEDKNIDSDINQPPYIEQANMITVLLKENIINGSMLDYAGGIGTLSKILNRFFNIELPIYDPYIKDAENETVKYVDVDDLTKVNTIINSALFEHIKSRQDLDHINNLVSEDGALIIHTVICENIPKDPNWFYFDPPVHSAIHTNSSMEILMSQWGYESSVYCKKAKCWVLFKKEPNLLKSKIDSINELFQTDYLIYKKGFVDYWK
jgi:hypothetical protein